MDTWVNKIARIIKTGTKGAIYLHRRFGVNYFQLLRSLLSRDKKITIPIKDLSVNMDIRVALYISNSLWNIEKYGWKLNINNVNDDLVIYENNQKGIKIYSRIDDALGYATIIEEIFIWEIYKADVKNKVVIDVGAYRGESAIYFALQGAKKVVALEPDEENYELALMNVKENELEDRVLLLNKAVADKEGVVNLYRYSYPSPHGSTDPSNIPASAYKTVVKQVEAITLDKVIKIAGERIGLLKLDCEGCEYSVLNSFSNYDMIDNIILEYHNGLQNLPSLLKSQGFEVEIKGGDNERIGMLRAYRG